MAPGTAAYTGLHHAGSAAACSCMQQQGLCGDQSWETLAVSSSKSRKGSPSGTLTQHACTAGVPSMARVPTAPCCCHPDAGGLQVCQSSPQALSTLPRCCAALALPVAASSMGHRTGSVSLWSRTEKMPTRERSSRAGHGKLACCFGTTFCLCICLSIEPTTSPFGLPQECRPPPVRPGRSGTGPAGPWSACRTTPATSLELPQR